MIYTRKFNQQAVLQNLILFHLIEKIEMKKSAELYVFCRLPFDWGEGKDEKKSNSTIEDNIPMIALRGRHYRKNILVEIGENYE